VCCLIYKVLLLFAVTFATAYLIYHTLSRLSSTFFKFFQTLFSSACLSRQLVYCIISAPLCQYLFSTFFQKLFQVSSSCSSSIFHRLIADSFYMISHKTQFVNRFFNFFDFASFSATACIYYHNYFDLSIGFLNFFQQAVEKR